METEQIAALAVDERYIAKLERAVSLEVFCTYGISTLEMEIMYLDGDLDETLRKIDRASTPNDALQCPRTERP